MGRSPSKGTDRPVSTFPLSRPTWPRRPPPSGAKRQGLFLATFLVVFWPLLHTSTMSRDVTDIHGDRADFASGEEVVSFFIGLFWRKKGLLAFWEGALSPAQKASPKSQKVLFSRKRTVKMAATLTLGKSERSVNIYICDRL